jgi:hypothetical protein
MVTIELVDKDYILYQREDIIQYQMLNINNVLMIMYPQHQLVFRQFHYRQTFVIVGFCIEVAFNIYS